MAGNLFVRSLERGDRIYSAMSARGYDGEVRTLGLPRVSRGEWTLLFAGILVLLGLLWLSLLLS
jgi:cobalt/nickel transport system permease protein